MQKLLAEKYVDCEMKVGRTSSFEVVVNGNVVHSKLGGNGFPSDYGALAAKIAEMVKEDSD